MLLWAGAYFLGSSSIYYLQIAVIHTTLEYDLQVKYYFCIINLITTTYEMSGIKIKYYAAY